MSLAIEPGETVALVGASGSGKSSLIHLLPRFYHPGSGRITVDGHDLETLTLESLRRQISLVSQNVVLFNDTVARQHRLRRAASSASEADIVARRRGRARDGIHPRACRRGSPPQIGENGAKLSGGQRQRIAIARAILKDAPILLLDEATSALDTESERAVQAALEELMRGRTTIVIAHRLSTIEKRRPHRGAGARAASSRPAAIASCSRARGVYAGLHRLQFAAA